MSRVILDKRPEKREDCPFCRYCDSQYAECNGGWYNKWHEFNFDDCKMCTVLTF